MHETAVTGTLVDVQDDEAALVVAAQFGDVDAFGHLVERNWEPLVRLSRSIPLVYASEGLRGALTPLFRHLSLPVVVAGLLAVNTLLLAIGLRRFHGKAIS